jgi:biofilm protein TabA
MVLDRIDNGERYYPLHPGFKPAFEYLKKIDLKTVPAGRQEIDGIRLFAVITRGQGKGIEKARLESHKNYIDIQCTISGTDLIGWKNISDCLSQGQGYIEEKDIEYFPGISDIWVKTPPGTFGIFFPEDVHAPMGSTEDLFKVILKVKVDWK